MNFDRTKEDGFGEDKNILEVPERSWKKIREREPNARARGEHGDKRRILQSSLLSALLAYNVVIPVLISPTWERKILSFSLAHQILPGLLGVRGNGRTNMPLNLSTLLPNVHSISKYSLSNSLVLAEVPL